MKTDTQTNFFQCQGCGSKFKKVCPANKACAIDEKCGKCGSIMSKIGNPYNRSKSAK